jgi:release factor glutamine methyltransferase
VTLALEWPSASVIGTDVSIAALATARCNAERLGASVDFRLTSLLEGVTPPVDLIVANPPYVTAADYDTLQPEVRTFEPRSALVGGMDGLDVVRALATSAVETLRPGGRLLIEIGVGQAEAVRRIVTETERLVLLRIRDDLQGTPRTVVATRRNDGTSAWE